MLRNLMPTINAATINLKSCRRVLLAHKNEEGGIELRQYAIRALPTGVSRGVKRITRAKRLPSLARCAAPRNSRLRNSRRAQIFSAHRLHRRARYADVYEYLLKGGAGGYSSDSAVETDEEEQAAAPDFGRAAPKAERVSIKLHELGPRLRLELVKVQEGLGDGAVLYHSHVTKTGDEAEATADAVARRAALKEERRPQQA